MDAAFAALFLHGVQYSCTPRRYDTKARPQRRQAAIVDMAHAATARLRMQQLALRHLYSMPPKLAEECRREAMDGRWRALRPPALL